MPENTSNRYVILWVSYVIFHIAKWAVYTVLTFSFYKTFKETYLGFWIAFYTFPIAFFAPIAGVYADQYSKKNIFLLCYGLSSILPLLLIFNFSALTACLICFFDSILSTQIYITVRSYIKEISDKHPTFINYHSWIVIAQLLPNAIGAGVGGWLIQYNCLHHVVIANFCAGIIAFTLILFIAYQKEVYPISSSFILNLKESFNFIRKDKQIKQQLFLFTIFSFFYAFLNAFFVIWSDNIFHNNVSFYTTALILGTVGVIIGTLCSKYFLIRYENGNHLILSFVLMILNAVIMISFSLFQGEFLSLILFFALNLSYAAVRNINTISLAQKSPSSLQGRILSFSHMLWNSSTCLCILLGGFLINIYGIIKVLKIVSFFFCFTLFTILILFLFIKLFFRFKYFQKSEKLIED